MRVARDSGLQRRIGAMLARHLAAVNILGRAQVVDEVRRKTGRRVAIAASSRHRPMHFDDGGADGDSPDGAGDALGAGYLTDQLPDRGAVGFLRGLTAVTPDTFEGLTTQYRRDAFTIAGTADLRLIGKIKDALAEVADEGGTSEEFKAAVDRLTTEAGVADLNAFTLDTAFQTAMQRAYSLGRYEQMTDPAVAAVLPAWQYWTVGDDRVRPEHRVLQGFTARVGDPVWNKIYPPNGFNCRCSVAPVLASEAGKDWEESGMLRLPLLARLKVPQAGFGKVFA